MKTLLIILIAILISGCHTTKKITESSAITSKTSEITKLVDAQTVLSIDTSKISDSEITYNKVEYYKPDSIVPSVGSDINSTIKQGPLKSIETWTVKKKTSVAGKAESKTSLKVDSTSVILENTAQKTSETKTPVPDPKRWRYIFYILLLLTGIFIYLKRSPIFTWLKSVLSKATGFLKI